MLKILIDVALPLNIILYAQRFIACTLDYLCSSRTIFFLLSRMTFPTILVFYMTISIIFVGKWPVQAYEAEPLLYSDNMYGLHYFRDYHYGFAYGSANILL